MPVELACNLDAGEAAHGDVEDNEVDFTLDPISSASAGRVLHRSPHLASAAATAGRSASGAHDVQA
jgi:hypothetical protein